MVTNGVCLVNVFSKPVFKGHINTRLMHVLGIMTLPSISMLHSLVKDALMLFHKLLEVFVRLQQVSHYVQVSNPCVL